MAYDEGLAKRNGITLPIQCIRMVLKPHVRALSMHYHDYTELLFGIAGTAMVSTGSYSCLLSEGDLVLIHPGEAHDVLWHSGQATYLVIKFLPKVLLTGEQASPAHGYALLLTENMPDKQCIFRAAELKKSDLPQRFAHLMEEWEDERFGYELSLRADITHIFLYILRRWQEDNLPLAESMRSGQGSLIGHAVAYVREHYSDLTEEETAAACGVSRTYFSRCFKRAMRIGFSAYVCAVRLREAERLLLTTSKSVTEIAEEVGFSTTSYFIARFRELHGVTPHQNRESALPHGNLPEA